MSLSGCIIWVLSLLEVLNDVLHADVGAEDHAGRPEQEDEQVLPQLPLVPGSRSFSGAMKTHICKVYNLAMSLKNFLCC